MIAVLTDALRDLTKIFQSLSGAQNTRSRQAATALIRIFRTFLSQLQRHRRLQSYVIVCQLLMIVSGLFIFNEWGFDFFNALVGDFDTGRVGWNMFPVTAGAAGLVVLCVWVLWFVHFKIVQKFHYDFIAKHTPQLEAHFKHITPDIITFENTLTMIPGLKPSLPYIKPFQKQDLVRDPKRYWHHVLALYFHLFTVSDAKARQSGFKVIHDLYAHGLLAGLLTSLRRKIKFNRAILAIHIGGLGLFLTWLAWAIATPVLLLGPSPQGQGALVIGAGLFGLLGPIIFNLMTRPPEWVVLSNGFGVFYVAKHAEQWLDELKAGLKKFESKAQQIIFIQGSPYSNAAQNAMDRALDNARESTELHMFLSHIKQLIELGKDSPLLLKTMTPFLTVGQSPHWAKLISASAPNSLSNQISVVLRTLELHYAKAWHLGLQNTISGQSVFRPTVGKVLAQKGESRLKTIVEAYLNAFLPSSQTHIFAHLNVGKTAILDTFSESFQPNYLFRRSDT